MLRCRWRCLCFDPNLETAGPRLSLLCLDHVCIDRPETTCSLSLPPLSLTVEEDRKGRSHISSRLHITTDESRNQLTEHQEEIKQTHTHQRIYESSIFPSCSRRLCSHSSSYKGMPNPGLHKDADGRGQPHQHPWQLPPRPAMVLNAEAPAWFLCALLELAVSFLLWSAAMASFVASKLIKMIGLHPPYFFPKSVMHRLGQQGSFVLDHVAQELCTLSHRVLHRNYTHDKIDDSFPHVSFSSRHLQTPNPTERHFACTDCLYKCYDCIQPRACAQNAENVATSAEVNSSRPTFEHLDSASRCSFRKPGCSSLSVRKSSLRGSTKKRLDHSFSLPNSCDSPSAMSASSKCSKSMKVFPLESTDHRVSGIDSDDSVMGDAEAETSETESKGNNNLALVDINDMTALVPYQSESSERGIGEEKSRRNHQLTSKDDALHEIYLELERERTAAASAAGEAMAMIAKLEKEKAALHIEAMQYQRIAEEKALCDEEAIDILRNLLLKEEEKRAALERELELYRKRLLKDEREGAERAGACSKSCDVFSRPADMDNLTLAQKDVEGIHLETQLRKGILVTELGAAELRKEDSGRGTNLYGEGHWQHLLERICKLEKNITVLKENLGMNVMQATAQFSGHSDIKYSMMQAHKREEAQLYIASASSDSQETDRSSLTAKTSLVACSAEGSMEQMGLCDVIPQLVECETSVQETACLSRQSRQQFDKNKEVCNDSDYYSSSAEEVAEQLRLLQASEAKLKALDITSETSAI